LTFNSQLNHFCPAWTLSKPR